VAPICPSLDGFSAGWGFHEPDGRLARRELLLSTSLSSSSTNSDAVLADRLASPTSLAVALVLAVIVARTFSALATAALDRALVVFLVSHLTRPVALKWHHHFARDHFT